jgi:hypothetical protein
MDIQDQVAPATEAEILAISEMSEDATYDNKRVIRNAQGRIIGGDDSDGPEDQLNVRFTTEAVFNKLLTYRNGGVPKYSDMDFVTISCPGSNTLTVHSPVTEYHKWRFPIEYANFKKGQGELISGTPLSLWPLLSQSQLREMDNIGIRTVEQVANLSDSNSGAFAGFHGLKSKAKQFLELANDKAAQGALQAELNERDQKHKAELAAMQAQMDQMLAMMTKANEPVAEKTSKAK